MELTILNTFTKFLSKNVFSILYNNLKGILDQEGVNHLNKCSNFGQQKEEKYEISLITNLADYLNKMKKEKRITALAHSLYEKYISLDDEKIEKTIKRLLLCYQNKRRKTLLNYFLKFKLISHKLNFITASLDSSLQNLATVYKKKKFQDVLSTKNSANISPLTNKNIIALTPNLSNKNEQIIDFNSSNKKKNFSNLKEEVKLEKKEETPKQFIKISNPENFEIIKEKKEIHNRLFEDGKRRQYLQNELASLERTREIKECTFSPKINKDNTISLNNLKDPAYIHLYEDRKNREQKIRRMNIEKEKQMNILYSFTPNLKTSKHKSKICSKEFFERLKLYDDSKSERFKKIKEEAEKIPDGSLRRNLRSQSGTRLRENSNLNVSFDVVEYQKKKKEKLKSIENSLLLEQGITFKPKLNESVNININSSLIERSRDFIRNRSEKLKAYKTKNDSECTFSPKVNNNNSSKPTFNHENENLNVGHRLFNYQNIYRNNLESRKDSLKEFHKFKPEINPNTYEILKKREITLKEMREKYDMNPKRKNFDINKNEFDKESESQNLNDILMKSNNNSNSNFNVEEDNKGYNTERLKSFKNLNIKMKSEEKSSVRQIHNESNQNFQAIQDNPSPGQDISDSRLMEMANHFITTDESLELFQARMREKFSKFNSDRSTQIFSLEKIKRSKSKNAKNYNNIPQYGSHKSQTDKNKLPQTENNKTSKSKDNKIFKNVDDALQYYNLLDN